MLLSQRRGGYGAGQWHLPSGKAEAGEPVTDAVIREAYEEVGVTVDADDLRCVHAVHVQHTGEEPRVGFFFEATRWHGEPVNREPDKCSAVCWFPLADLPDAVIPYPAAGISGYLTGVPFSILGSGDDTPRPASPSARGHRTLNRSPVARPSFIDRPSRHRGSTLDEIRVADYNSGL